MAVDAGVVLRSLEQDLEADWKHYHVQAHASQFAALFVGAFVSSIATGGWHVAGWGALAGVALASAGAAVRQVLPQVPWSVVKQVVEDAKDAVDRPAPAAAPPIESAKAVDGPPTGT